MDSEDFGGLLGGDITHLKTLNSTAFSVNDLVRYERVGQIFSYLVLRLKLLHGFALIFGL